MSYNATPIKLYSYVCDFPDVEMAVNSSTKSWLSKHNVLGPLFLYHYTTIEGLKGMIIDRSIWCTYIDDNKYKEDLKYGKNLIISRLNIFIEREKNVDIQKILMGIKNFSSFVYHRTHYIFIASLFERGNLSSRWKGSASKGVRYNLGISFDSETKIDCGIDAPLESRNIVLRKVVYEQSEQIKIIDDFISVVSIQN
ncbi:MAG: hypothetical protein P4L35_09065 [Ignavibacteriaceae bacterium]|nr:hypothetical protein [Ignavibacteriaceae bacterium]